MKKLFYLLTLSLIFVFGCSKEDSGIQNPSSANLKLETLSFDGKTLSNERTSITLEELQAKSASASAFRLSGDSKANGHFSTQQGNTITFSSGEDGDYGNFNIKGVVNFKGDLICTTVEGNQAVIQVVVTQVGTLPDGFPDILGWTFLYLIEDNGEGKNAPSDRYFSLALNAPFDFGVCIEMSPSVLLWINGDCGCNGVWEDTVKSSDQIQIK